MSPMYISHKLTGYLIRNKIDISLFDIFYKMEIASFQHFFISSLNENCNLPEFL